MPLFDTILTIALRTLFLVFVVPIALFWLWMKVDHFAQARRGYIIEQIGYNHDIAVTYTEGKQTLYLSGKRETMTIAVPTPEQWQTQMPDWAQERRSEIMSRIYRHCQRSRYKFNDRAL